MAKKTKKSLMLADNTDRDWEAVTTDLCDFIRCGGTRQKYVAQKHTPSLMYIGRHIGAHDDRTARVHNAYRFRAEGRIDDLMDARESLAGGDMTPTEFNNLQHGLLREVGLLTNMATTPNKAEPIKKVTTTDELAARVERAASRADDDEDDEA